MGTKKKHTGGASINTPEGISPSNSKSTEQDCSRKSYGTKETLIVERLWNKWNNWRWPV